MILNSKYTGPFFSQIVIILTNMFKSYNKNFEYSYAIGVAPTIEALEKRVGEVVKVIINPKGLQNSGIPKIIDICKRLNISIENNQKQVEKLALNENTYAVAVFKKYTTTLSTTNNHVVLVNPSDMGNLGTICRTMLALDFTDLVIIKPAVDIFDPKAIRASMGAVFSLNFEYFSEFDDYKKRFGHNLYTFMCDGDNLLDKVKFKNPYSLVFGNEGNGLDDKYKEKGVSVKIPQNTKVDSLNLSVAVSIALYGAYTNK